MSTPPVSPSKSNAPFQPNVIWVFGDQHRAQALGHRGDPNVRTPNIDRLAREGVRFDAACAGTPWCAPFRAALLTGRYPHQVGVPNTPAPLDPAIPTVAKPFRDGGYHTAYVGKWHLDGSNKDHVIPPDRRGGFDYWLGYENYNSPFDAYVHGTDCETPRRLEGYETDGLTGELIRHLQQHVTSTSGDARTGSRTPPPGRMPDDAQRAAADYQPFFAALSVTPPHNPYVAPARFAGRFGAQDLRLRPNVPAVEWVREKARDDLAGYYAMIENLDENVGRLLEALRRLRIDEHTVVVFFSDHGDMHGSHAQFGKSTPWEEAIRIPMIVSGLGGSGLCRSGRCDAVLNHVDISATTLGTCGLEVPEAMAGHDYSRRIVPPTHPLYRGDAEREDEPDSAYLQQLTRKFHAHSVNRQWRGVTTRHGWKYVCQPGHDWLMFNLRDDPFEQANLVYDKVFENQRQELHQRLDQWINKTGDTFELPAL